jgi:hypothetical protein
MRINNNGSEDLLHSKIQLEIELTCGICGHFLESNLSCDKIRVMPCAHCINANHVTTHAGRIAALKDAHAKEINKKQELEQQKQQKIEDAIYKKFEARFKELMKQVTY